MADIFPPQTLYEYFMDWLPYLVALIIYVIFTSKEKKKASEEKYLTKITQLMKAYNDMLYEALSFFHILTFNSHVDPTSVQSTYNDGIVNLKTINKAAANLASLVVLYFPDNESSSEVVTSAIFKFQSFLIERINQIKGDTSIINDSVKKDSLIKSVVTSAEIILDSFSDL